MHKTPVDRPGRVKAGRLYFGDIATGAVLRELQLQARIKHFDKPIQLSRQYDRVSRRALIVCEGLSVFREVGQFGAIAAESFPGHDTS
jgi:hypothetical protein